MNQKMPIAVAGYKSLTNRKPTELDQLDGFSHLRMVSGTREQRRFDPVIFKEEPTKTRTPMRKQIILVAVLTALFAAGFWLLVSYIRSLG